MKRAFMPIAALAALFVFAGCLRQTPPPPPPPAAIPAAAAAPRSIIARHPLTASDANCWAFSPDIFRPPDVDRLLDAIAVDEDGRAVVDAWATWRANPLAPAPPGPAVWRRFQPEIDLVNQRATLAGQARTPIPNEPRWLAMLLSLDLLYRYTGDANYHPVLFAQVVLATAELGPLGEAFAAYGLFASERDDTAPARLAWVKSELGAERYHRFLQAYSHAFACSSELAHQLTPDERGLVADALPESERWLLVPLAAAAHRAGADPEARALLTRAIDPAARDCLFARLRDPAAQPSEPLPLLVLSLQYGVVEYENERRALPAPSP